MQIYVGEHYSKSSFTAVLLLRLTTFIRIIKPSKLHDEMEMRINGVNVPKGST